VVYCHYGFNRAAQTVLLKVKFAARIGAILEIGVSVLKSNRFFQTLIIAIGCLYIGLIVFTNYSILPMRSKLKTSVLDVIQTGHQKDEAQMTDEILDKIQRLDNDMTRDLITIVKRRENAGHFVVEAHVSYRPHVEFFFANVEVDMSISEEIPLIEF